MAELKEQGALKQQFRSTIMLGDFLDEAKSMVAPVESNHTKLINEGLARGVQVQMGMGDAKSVAGGLNGANGAEAVRLRDEKEAKEKKKRAADQLLQNLLDQIAAIDAEIEGLNEQIQILEDKIDALDEAIHALQSGEGDVDSVMSDPHVQDAVRDWERRTGKKFDADADNAQDVLVAILASQQDEYGNDIAALKTEINVLEVEREGLVAQVQSLDAQYAADPDVAIQRASEIVETSYQAAEVFGHETTTEIIEARGSIDQDKHSDVTTGAVDAASRNETSFGGLGALLDNAGEDFASQFQTASAEPVPNSEVTPILENSIDVSMKV